MQAGTLQCRRGLAEAGLGLRSGARRIERLCNAGPVLRSGLSLHGRLLLTRALR